MTDTVAWIVAAVAVAALAVALVALRHARQRIAWEWARHLQRTQIRPGEDGGYIVVDDIGAEHRFANYDEMKRAWKAGVLGPHM